MKLTSVLIAAAAFFALLVVGKFLLRRRDFAPLTGIKKKKTSAPPPARNPVGLPVSFALGRFANEVLLSRAPLIALLTVAAGAAVGMLAALAFTWNSWGVSSSTPLLVGGLLGIFTAGFIVTIGARRETPRWRLRRKLAGRDLIIERDHLKLTRAHSPLLARGPKDTEDYFVIPFEAQTMLRRRFVMHGHFGGFVYELISGGRQFTLLDRQFDGCDMRFVSLMRDRGVKFENAKHALVRR